MATWLSVSLTASASLVISEFLAVNQDGLEDEFTNTEDWIEIYNTGDQPVNAEGWRLTDDQDDLSKWTFPSTSIPAGGYAVVFASGRTLTSPNLHANFKLSGDGEYLALVDPNGNIASEFDPTFPPQFGDVSYGVLAGTLVSNINLQTPWRAMVPTVDTGNEWKTTGFDPGGWAGGSVGIGYDTGSSYNPHFDMDFEDDMRGAGKTPSAYLRIPFTIDDPAKIAALTLRLKYDDGFVAFINGNRVAEANEPTPLLWNSSAEAQNPDGNAIVYEPFPVPNPSQVLQAGENILAIHGLNISTDSSDFLIAPELEAEITINVELDQFRYFATPTPGGANSSDFLGFVDDVAFSVERGLYDAPFSVALSNTTPDAKLHYTTDGSNPLDSPNAATITPAPGGTALVNLPVTGTQCLRAAATKTGFEPGTVITHTYLFPDDVVNQDFAYASNIAGFPGDWNGTSPDYGIDYDGEIAVNDVKSALTNLPSVSIVTSVDEIFGQDGFYSNPSQNANVEVGCSTELIHPDGSEGFQINCAIKVQGGAFRNWNLTKKKSFRLTFTSEYGPTKLKYPVFGEDPSIQQEFDTLVLRMEANDGWQWASAGDQPLYARDQFNRDLARAVGIPAGHGNYTHVYLNGVYWGVYNLVERPDNSFGAAYFGADKDLWQGINSGSAINGDPNNANSAWTTLISLAQSVTGAATEDAKTDALLRIQGLNPNGSNNPAQESYLNVDNYIDYLLVNYWADNSDWPRKNYYVGRDGAPGTEGFNFFMWDSEWSLFLRSEVNDNDIDDDRGVGEPLQDLRTSREFRIRFGDRAHRALFNGGPLYVDPANPGWNPAFPERNRPAALWAALTEHHPDFLWSEAGRWGDQHNSSNPYTVVNWQIESNEVLNNWMPVRSGNFINILRSEALYPTVDAPVFNRHGGTVLAGFNLDMSAPAGTVYYSINGSDPREFRTDSAVGIPYTGAIPLNHSAVVKARAQTREWSALNEAVFIVRHSAALAVSEIMYHAREPGPAEAGFTPADFDFIEVANTGAETIGLPGYLFTSGVRFDFTYGAVDKLDPGEFAVVVSNLDAFKLRYSNWSTLSIAGQYRGDLDNGGEPVVLENPPLGIRLKLAYDDSRGWHPSTESGGHSLVPMDPGGQLVDPARFDFGGNWRASTFLDGSPGGPDPAPVRTVLVNELAAHTDTTVPGFDSDDWVELYNTTLDPQGLADWYLSDDQESLRKFPLAGLLEGGDWVTFNETVNGLNFGLNKAGETLYLSHLPGSGGDRIADAVQFRAQENGVTWGRYTDGAPYWQPLPPTPGTANGVPGMDVRIHEVMFHPSPTETHPEDNSHDEYIVLHNPLSIAVDLFNADGEWRVRGEVDYDVPPGTSIPAGGYIALVNFDPDDSGSRAIFEDRYGSGVTLFGPYGDKLSNRGGRITLERPQAGDALNELRSWVTVDEFIYFDRDPFGDSADGTGLALHRVDETRSGNDPSAWRSGLPTIDGGAIAWPEVRLVINHLPDDTRRLDWTSFPGLTYIIEYHDDTGFNPQSWTGAATFTTEGPQSWNDAIPGANGFRAYRMRLDE